MRLVILESPFRGRTPRESEAFRVYAIEAMRHSLRKGEAPFASHLLYTLALDDTKTEERIQGIESGLAWGQKAEATVAYIDLGISSGMALGIARAEAEGRPVEYRRIR